jgi:ferritin-like metal-binding protein YciE
VVTITVAETSSSLIKRYIEDAIAAERSFEARLRGFAEEGDDAEVQAAFLTHAEETRLQHERLAARLQALGGNASSVKSFLEQLFSFSSKSTQIGQSRDERLLQNLILAFALEKSECAMYEALATVAVAAGDAATEELARDIQAQESETADKFWRFLPSRSKIAFNLATAGEIDPAIETKAPDDRVL